MALFLRDGNVLSRVLKCLKESVKMDAVGRPSEILYLARIREKELLRNLENMCQLERSSPCSGGNDIEYLRAHLNQINDDRYRGALI